MTVFTPDITGLQPNPDGGFDRNNATLSLFQRTPYPTRHFQETVDSTVIGGMATFGGFWTFINGAFAILFGANVLYFAFGESRTLISLLLITA
jgi:hypothetical protein